MKKTISILLLVLLIAGVIISCDNKVKANSNETVSVSFVESSSRDLIVTHDTLTPNQLYWKYAARKSPNESSSPSQMADGSNLSQGATDSYDVNGAKWIKTNSKDTKPTEQQKGYGVVGGFSQGLWDFKLFGYTKVGDAYKLVVEGESKNVSLVFGGPNAVSVKVAPVSSSDQGTLTIDKIGFNYAKTSGDSLGTGVSYNVKVTNLTDAVQSGTKNDDTNVYTYTLNPGAYKATISYSLDTDPKYTFATGTKLVQVWSNQNTTISGSLNELITSADFSATIDPLVLYASTDTTEKTSSNQGLTFKDKSSSHKLILEIPNAVADYYIKNYKDTTSSREQNAGDEINFTASVETTAISNGSVKYNIALDYSVKPIYASNFQGPFEIAEIDSSLSSVTIILAIDKGLTINKVGISDFNFGSNSNVDDLKSALTGYYYNSVDGLLYIKTMKLGDLVVEYTR